MKRCIALACVLGCALLLVVAASASSGAAPQSKGVANALTGSSSRVVLDPAGERSRRVTARAQERKEQARIERARVAWGQIALLGLALGILIDRGRRQPRLATVARRWLLGLLAVAAAGSYFADDPFDPSPGQLHLKDVYHYWMGTRYFDELGYDGLYDCTLAVASQRGSPWVAGIAHARDLRSNEIRPVDELVARGRAECPARFSAARWQAFAEDVAWFEGVLGLQRWRGLLNDHGYNPSPVWALCARPFASWPSPASVVWLARLDLVLLAGALAAIGWAFGLEAALVVTIVWGTGWLWDARWVGHAFLRQIWFATSALALCFMKKGWGAGAGALAAVATTTRVFPGLMALGWATTLARASGRAGPDAKIAWRGLAGFAALSIVLVAATLWAFDDGLHRWSAFAQNLSTLRSMPSVNLVGLEPLLWRFDGTSQLWHQGATLLPEVRASAHPASRAIRILMSLLALGLAGRAMSRAKPWEAGTIGLFLLPVLAAPAGYYMQFVVLGALLGARRPRVTVALVAACIAWSLGGILIDSAPAAFGLASGVALVLSFYVLASSPDASAADALETSGRHSGAQRMRRPAAPE